MVEVFEQDIRTNDRQSSGDLYEMIRDVKAKTIDGDFDEQLTVSEDLYKENLKFSFTRADVRDLLERATIYSKEERARVETILYHQMRKYQCLFG